MKKDRKSIIIKVLRLIVACLILITFVFSISLYFFDKNKEEVKLKKLSNRIKERLLNALILPVWNLDPDGIDTSMKLEMYDENVLSVILLKDNKELWSGFIKDNNNEIIKYDEKQNYLLSNSYLKSASEIIKDDIVLGYVEIYFSDNALKSTLKIVLVRIISQSVLFSILILLIIFFSLKLMVLDNIINLNNIVSEFAKKDFSVRLNYYSNDEIGSLTNNFNNMAEIIQNYSKNLEDMVKKRTQQLQEAYDQMKKELEMAQKIQEAIIPKDFPMNDVFNLSGMYVPMANIGGDYYDVIKINENKIAIVIADVCGHGVPAALITTMTKMAFFNYSQNIHKSNDVVKNVNSELFKIIGNMEYLTAFYGIIDLEKETLEYTNAGHNDVFIMKKSGDVKKLISNSPIIGFLDGVDYQSETVNLEVSDRIVLFTDGIPELRNSKDELYGMERFLKILKDNNKKKPKDLLSILTDNLNEFKMDFKPQDDMTILVIDIIDDMKRINIDYEIIADKIEMLPDDDSFNNKIHQYIEIDNRYLQSLDYLKKNNPYKAKDILVEIKDKYNRKTDNFKVLYLLGHANYKLKEYEEAFNNWMEAKNIVQTNNELNYNIEVLKKKLKI